LDDPFSHGPRVPQFVALFGKREFTTRGGHVKSALNQMTVANFSIETAHTSPIDLSSPLSVVVVEAGAGPEGEVRSPRFSGHVTSGRFNGTQLHVDAESGREFAETTNGVFASLRVPPLEIAYFLARGAGLPDERIKIEGLKALPPEVFLVQMLVSGVHLDTKVRHRGVSLEPLGDSDDGVNLGPFARAAEYISPAGLRPACLVTVYVTARRMLDAEEEGVSRIRQYLDGLLATSAYGLSHDPWGQELDFDRDHIRARPSAIPFVAVSGVRTRRTWMHAIGNSVASTELNLASTFDRWSSLLLVDPDAELRRALSAFRDAADDARDIIDRCQAISTSLEFYCASSRPPKIVAPSAMKAAREAIKALDLDAEERSRLLDVINTANNPPLFARIRFQAERDAVPLLDEEWELLRRLRSARNDAVHGHRADANVVDFHDVRWGVSILARLLLYRWKNMIEEANVA
jgi:hypothetical protein